MPKIDERLHTRTSRYASRELVAGINGELPRLFGRSFDSRYLGLIEESLGHHVSILELWRFEPAPVLVAAFPFSCEEPILSSWASRTKDVSSGWSQAILEEGAVILDFCVISPLWRGRALSCFSFAASKLAERGFRLAITEVQWLRQLALWLRGGWQPMSAIRSSQLRKLPTVGRAIRSARIEPNLLEFGERVIYLDSPASRSDRKNWNVVLPEPVFLVRAL